MILTIFKFPFLITQLKLLKTQNPALYHELRCIRKCYPYVWKLIQKLGDWPIDHIKFQHNIIRQLLLFERGGYRNKCLLLDQKARTILSKFPLKSSEVGREHDIMILLKEEMLKGDVLVTTDITLGGKVDLQSDTYVYHGTMLRSFFKHKLRKIPKYEFL
jgi:hypothetical protein